jgi:hypothetical protein
MLLAIQTTLWRRNENPKAKAKALAVGIPGSMFNVQRS